MSFPGEIQFSSARAYIDLNNVQFADFSKVAVADFSNVQYFQQQTSDAEDNDEVVEEGKFYVLRGVHGKGYTILKI